MTDGEHINLQPAVTIISINFPSYRTPHTSPAFHSENQTDEINETKRTGRLLKSYDDRLFSPFSRPSLSARHLHDHNKKIWKYYLPTFKDKHFCH
jgi:hypothetical protein